MKKYKLLKDLPMAYAGTIVGIEQKPLPANREILSVYLNDDTRESIAIIRAYDISEWLEEIPEKQKSVWELEYGDSYYLIHTDGGIDRFLWGDYEVHRKRRKQGNVFITREEAKKERDRRNAIFTIQEWCWKENIMTNYSEDTYAFFLDYGNIVRYGMLSRNGNPLGYFSYENTKKILEKFEPELRLILS